ncbi:MAG: ABC transporter ATP-binding protein [Clostridiales bacterium]|nr:ABC transporter ATP-binding protein [Clostridiales bacterium]
MRYLLKNLKKYRKESILAPLFKMLEALFDLFVPLVVQDIINVGIRDHNTVYILQRCGLMVGLAVVGLICSITAQYFSARAAVGCAAGLRHDLFSHIQTLNFSEMDQIGTSTLITRMTSDINQVQNGLNMFLRLFLRSPFIVFGAMIMAFTIHPRLALIFAVIIPVLFVIIFGIMKWTSPLYKKVQTKLDTVLGITRENLSGVRVVRAFNKEQSETERFQESNEQLNREQLHVGRISGLMNPLTYAVVNLGIIAILYMGGAAVNSGSLMDGSVIALINYASQILVELIKLANTVVLISRALASLSRVEMVLDTKPSMIFPNSPSPTPASEEAVRFDHVNLRYAGAGEDSLTDVSFCAMRGQTIGVIGGTGSGKTSLVSLIPRFYDATGGKITLEGKPITAWAKEELRGHVGVVPQRAQLFTGTIRSNLLWGNPDASEEQLEKALETAQALDFVRKKPLGLDEPVEQGGRNFSGGQKQRLTIARALVKEPEILILDDSASALDFATDAALRKALRTLPEHITVFIVSQRTSSLQHADQILVLEDGRLAGGGSHAALLESCQVYREIYESQFK